MPKKSELHQFMRHNGLEITIKPDVGVTPCEPDFYWSLWVCDQEGMGERCIAECTEGDTSVKSLADLIVSAVERWKKEFGKAKSKAKKRG